MSTVRRHVRASIDDETSQQFFVTRAFRNRIPEHRLLDLANNTVVVLYPYYIVIFALIVRTAPDSEPIREAYRNKLLNVTAHCARKQTLIWFAYRYLPPLTLGRLENI